MLTFGVNYVAALTILAMLPGCSQGGDQAQKAVASPSATAHYLPEFTSDGKLILPKNFERWVYVGSPLTPNALNGGKAAFPEFQKDSVWTQFYSRLTR